MKQTNWIGLKELILVTLLSALWIVVGLVVMLPFTTNLTLALIVAPAVALLINGTTYTLMCTKAPKHGTLLLFGVIEAIYNYISVGMPIVAIVNLATGVLMELVMMNDGYRNKIRQIIAYAIFCVGWVSAPLVAMLMTKASTEATLLAAGFDQAYIDAAFAMYSMQNIVIACVVGLIGAILGCVIGQRILKKHFVAAGVVQEK